MHWVHAGALHMISPSKEMFPENDPDTLNLFFTGKCNLGCHYCFVDRACLHNTTVSADALKKSIDLLLSRPGQKKQISYMGGEPTIEFALVKESFNYAKEQAQRKGISLEATLTTNGTLLNQEMVDYFIANKVMIKLSIEGDKAVHDQNRPFKANPKRSSYDKIMDNMAKIDSDGLRMAVSMVFAPKDIDSLLDRIQFLNSKGFRWIDFYPELYARWSLRDLEKVQKFFVEFEAYYIGLFKEKKMAFKNSRIDALVNDVKIDKMRCCKKVHLNAEEEFYVCDKVFSLDAGNRGKYVVGSIDEGIDIKKRSKMLSDIHGEFLQEGGLKCAGCPVYQYCFCPLGHFIYYRESKNNGDGKAGKDLLKSFCFFSKVYTRAVFGIKKALMPYPEFMEMYNIRSPYNYRQL